MELDICMDKICRGRCVRMKEYNCMVWNSQIVEQDIVEFVEFMVDHWLT